MTVSQTAAAAPATSVGVPPSVDRGVLGRRSLAVLGGYLVASLVLWRSLLPHLTTHVLGGGTLDPGIFIWWIRWVPFAIAHGMDPLRSTYVNAPRGVSAMWNTSVTPLGLVLAPVTVLGGPVLSFNVACILGPPLSAWTAWLWLRRHVRDIAAAIGGLLFGFSPFVIAESHAGHLMFTWLPLLPLALMLVEDLLWRSARPGVRAAALLGLLVAVQFLLGSEALLVFSLGCALTVLLLAGSHPRRALERLRSLVPALAVAAGVSLLLCAWPLVEQFGGGRAIHKPVQPLGALGGNLAMLVGAPRTLLFHTGNGPRGHLTSVENGLYIGWPLLVLLAVTCVVLRRRRGVIIAATVAIVAVALQMHGTRWNVAGHSVRAPLAVLQGHLKITQHILPGRFAIDMWLPIAWIVAVAVDTAMSNVLARWPTPASRVMFASRPVTWAIVPPIVAIACLVPLLPAAQSPTTRLAHTPALFESTSLLRRTVPRGATVMVAPMATVANAAADLWQVESDMRFRQLGGYMLHAVGSNGSPSYYPAAENLTRLFAIDGTTRKPYAREPTPTMLDAARAELRAARASLFMVGYARYGEPRLLALARQLLGRPPDRVVGGVAIWSLPAAR